MATFGEQLRKFRQQCNDTESPHGRLTQERLGELIGRELGIEYSGAAISDWERGVSKIHKDHRSVLMSLIRILHQRGGIQNLADANQLLEAGNYRALNVDEAKQIFGKIPDLNARESILEQKSSGSFPSFLLTNLFSISEDEAEILLAKAEQGPSPSWPRVMAAIFRRFSDRLSAAQMLAFVLWIWLWLLAWWLIAPSLRWSFPSRADAVTAIQMYVIGSIIIPALIGVLTKTKDNEFWKAQESLKQTNLRFYTHQGASIGFHLGYFFIFMFSLLRYNLGLDTAIWLEFVAIAFPVIVGYASARLVPYNLFLAYQRLSLRDGAIFFIFFLLGPAWGYFFLQSYEILLNQSLGVFVFLLAVTILACATVWQNHRRDKIIDAENIGHRE